MKMIRLTVLIFHYYLEKLENINKSSWERSNTSDFGDHRTANYTMLFQIVRNIVIWRLD